MCKITVALITYNRPNLLRTAISSIINQSYKDFELLILDNGSSKDTYLVVSEFDDKRIKYHYNPVNFREFYNYPFFIAKGEFLIITHDDDFMDPSLLLQELNAFENMADVVCVSSNMRGINLNNEVIYSRMHPFKENIILGKNQYLKFFLEGNSLFAPTVMFRLDFLRRKSLLFELNKVGPACDQYLWYQILRNDVKIAILPDVLYNYRIHPDQDSVINGPKMDLDLLLILLEETSINKGLYYDEQKIILKKIFNLINQHELLTRNKKNLIRRFNYSFQSKHNFSFIKIGFFLTIMFPRANKFIQNIAGKFNLTFLGI